MSRKRDFALEVVTGVCGELIAMYVEARPFELP